ncbi:MAG: hypothetical protein QXU18_16350, partial [Thermoplasmatales archaeon]
LDVAYVFDISISHNGKLMFMIIEIGKRKLNQRTHGGVNLTVPAIWLYAQNLYAGDMVSVTIGERGKLIMKKCHICYDSYHAAFESIKSTSWGVEMKLASRIDMTKDKFVYCFVYCTPLNKEAAFFYRAE